MVASVAGPWGEVVAPRQPQPSGTIICASTYVQAAMVAEMEGLKPREVTVVTEDASKILGMLPARVLVAFPVLTESQKHYEVRDLVRYRARRAGIEVEYVRT